MPRFVIDVVHRSLLTENTRARYVVFMIIFGTRGVTMNHEKGNFDCPGCGQAAYAHKRVRRFFTLYFIPVIPLDLLGEYVECSSCKETYKPEVLSYDRSGANAEFEAEFHNATRAVMVMMMLADGIIDDDEVTTISKVYEAMTGKPLEEAAVRRQAAELQGRDVLEVMRALAGTLNDNGKETVLRAAFMVAAADGNIADEEVQLLGEIGNTLDMSKAHLKGVLQTLSDELA